MRCPIPHCGRPLPDEHELYRHLRDHHRFSIEQIRRQFPELIGSGWHEERQKIPTNKGLEDKAVEHRLAYLKSQPPPLSVPIVPAHRPSEVKVPQGWRPTQTGYVFEQQISEQHLPDNEIVKVLRAEIGTNWGKAILYTYDKDLQTLNELEDKAGILKARLVSFVPSDPEFVTIANELHEALFRLREHRRDIRPEEHSGLILEDHYPGDIGTDEHREWQSEFMERTLHEAERLRGYEKSRGPEEHEK